MTHAGTMARAPKAQHRRAPPTRPVARLVFLIAFSVEITPTSPAAAEKIHEVAERSGIRAPGDVGKSATNATSQAGISPTSPRTQYECGSRSAAAKARRVVAAYVTSPPNAPATMEAKATTAHSVDP